MASIRKCGDLQWEARIRRKGHPVRQEPVKEKAPMWTYAESRNGKINGNFLVPPLDKIALFAIVFL